MKRTARQMQMGGLPLEAATPATSSLQVAIESLLGVTTFADLSFPNAVGCHTAMAHQFLLAPRPEIETRFFQRFRQAGGHVPVPSVDLSLDQVVWPDQLRQLDGTVVMCLGSFNEWHVNSEKLRQSGCAVLVPAPRELSDSRVSAKAELSGYRIVALLESRRATLRYVLLLPRHEERAADLGKALQCGNFAKVIFEIGEAQLVIDAGAMIHDGGYASEGDMKYSWLWTGPSTHFRLIMPQVAGCRPRRAEVCIPRAEDDANLNCLAVQIDGRPAPFRVERWSETSGKICVDVPDGESCCIMTIVTPALTRDTNSGRQIGLCLDKLIVSA